MWHATSIASITIELHNTMSQNNVSELRYGALTAANRVWVEGAGGGGENGPVARSTCTF